MEKAVITIGGGSRGLGNALLNKFRSNGYKAIAFHRQNSIPDVANYYLDIDNKLSVQDCIKRLNSLLEDRAFKHISIHFLSGGSFGLQRLETDQNQLIKSTMHNYLLPVIITDLITKQKLLDDDNKLEINLIYYSSAVTQHLSANPHYCGSKSALEAYFKSAFTSCPKSIKMYLFRLGMVDIKHKYFHKLLETDKKSFYKLLNNNVPSGHFTSPDEVADIVANICIDRPAANGVICDISGGNSWS